MLEFLKKFQERKFLIVVIAWLAVALKNFFNIELGEDLQGYIAEFTATLFTVIFMIVETVLDKKKIEAQSDIAIVHEELKIEPAKPDPEPIATPVPIIQFNPSAFMERVAGKVGQMYGVVNKSTTYYTAVSTFYNDWVFESKDAQKDCADLLISLAKDAFGEIWGTTWDDELNKVPTPESCEKKDFRERAISKGMEYYTAYLDVTGALKIRNQV